MGVAAPVPLLTEKNAHKNIFLPPSSEVYQNDYVCDSNTLCINQEPILIKQAHLSVGAFPSSARMFMKSGLSVDFRNPLFRRNEKKRMIRNINEFFGGH